MVAVRPVRKVARLPTGAAGLEDLLTGHTQWGIRSTVAVVDEVYTNPVASWSPIQRPPRPVRTVFVMLEAEGANGWRFDLNHAIAPDNRIVYEPDQSLRSSPAAFRRLAIEPERVAGTAAYLSNTWPDNYSHWMFLTLPLIERYRAHLDEDPDYWYVGGSPRSWQLESLERAGIDRSRVKTGPIRPDRLVICAAGRYGRGVDSTSLTYARRIFEVDDNADRTRRIFLARGTASTRRFINESMCFEAVRDFGFEFVETTGLTLQAEADLFANAETVISCHGSACVNLIFAPRGTTLIELFPPELDLDSATVFVELMSAVGGRHAAMFGAPGTGGRRAIDADVNADPEKLRELVRQSIAANDGWTTR